MVCDFNGDGTLNDLLPGSRVNQLGRGLGKDDLTQLVQNYNEEFANQRTPGGQTAPLLTLPATYGLHDSFFTQDLRLSRGSFRRFRLAAVPSHVPFWRSAAHRAATSLHQHLNLLNLPLVGPILPFLDQARPHRIL